MIVSAKRTGCPFWSGKLAEEKIVYAFPLRKRGFSFYSTDPTFFTRGQKKETRVRGMWPGPPVRQFPFSIKCHSRVVHVHCMQFVTTCQRSPEVNRLLTASTPPSKMLPWIFVPWCRVGHFQGLGQVTVPHPLKSKISLSLDFFNRNKKDR